MFKKLSILFLVFLLPSFLLGKTHIKEKNEVGIHVVAFEYVKRRTAWMYNIEVFNPDKNMLTTKIYAKDETGKENKIAVEKFDKRGISKKFDNNNYISLRAELFQANKKIDEKSLTLPKVKAKIVNFSLKNDRWFLKVRNEAVESMEFKIILQEENSVGVKSILLEYETQNLDSQASHNRTSILKKLTINNRLTLIVKDIVSNKILDAKTITLE